MLERYLNSPVKQDLQKKMVFIGGPRQVGKTVFSCHLFSNKYQSRYFNWDDDEDRERILNRQWPRQKGLIVFDEIHKYRRWRQIIKGLYDKYKEKYRILVTGSARLYRLHPFSFAELGCSSQKELESLFFLTGFPEPFLEGKMSELKRWAREYRTRLIREDLRDLEHVSEIGRIEQLMIRLPELVGSPISLNSLREDLQVSQPTVARWCDILERLYAIFRVSPFGAPKIRAVKKEQKHYHFDWSVVKDEGARFENLVACHLLKWVHFEQDTKGRELDLRYFRDIDGREVDFVITEDNCPLLFIESKISDGPITKGLKYLKERFSQAEAWQISLRGQKDYQCDDIRVVPATVFLKTLC